MCKLKEESSIWSHLRRRPPAWVCVLQELREGLWIDRSTRLLILDTTFYNANINVFAIVKLAMEFLPTGGFILNPQITTAQVLGGYVDNREIMEELANFCYNIDIFTIPSVGGGAKGGGCGQNRFLFRYTILLYTVGKILRRRQHDLSVLRRFG
jgi:hypothetical protein